jgi:hypothetical protein
MSAGVTPKTVNLKLNPGESVTIGKDVQTTKLPPDSDFVFLADNTGSMGSSINDVKANSQAIIDAIEAAGATNARYGVANYQDTTAFGACPYLFQLNTDLTTAAAAKAAINTWSAGNGCDLPESALYALHKVAVRAIHWRADTFGARFVVWFGDAPSHEPICNLLPGYSDSSPVVTESSATADLVGQGIHVIAASASSGPGLDADPKLSSEDYPPPCAESEQGKAGQALRIATATGGVDLPTTAPDKISQAIITAINALPPVPVVVTPVATCDAGLTVSNMPPTQTVPSGSTAHFSETISVSPAAPLGSTLHCTVDFTINGASAGPEFQQQITVEVGHGVPTKLVLTPKTATKPVDSKHCVTATVTDAFGDPVPGVVVDFKVAGEDNLSGSATTNAAGQATFCYTVGSFPGADVITATAEGGTHPTDVATKTITLPENTPGCKVTGGGRITAANGDKGTFGGNAMGTGPSGQEEYQRRQDVSDHLRHGDRQRRRVVHVPHRRQGSRRAGDERPVPDPSLERLRLRRPAAGQREHPDPLGRSQEDMIEGPLRRAFVVHQTSTSLSRKASATACARLRTPSLARIRSMCDATVFVLITSRSAISRCSSPSASNASTWRSRFVSVDGAVPFGPTRRNAALARPSSSSGAKGLTT